ncbi:MAG: M20 aminoacylase family protein [Burkholderiaceae bacterium]
MKLVDSILASQAEMTAIRRDLHAHPELRYEETRTADLVAERLRGWGIDVDRGLGKTGVVGTIRHGTGTGTIGLRADMDALPMPEHNTFAHRSRHPGKMHACGHDGHTTMLLAAARHLAQHRRFDGTVHLIFQPAEEGGAGARAMMDDGLFDRFPCDAVFGMHNWPGMKAGTFGVCAGPTMASSNEFEITLTGRGTHAAMPHLGVDPVIVATHLVQALQTIVSRNLKPIDTAVLSVTQIHVGDAYNVVADEAVIRGTVRTFTDEVLDLVESRMREIVTQLPPVFGAAGALHFKRNYPPLVNHAEQTAFCRTVAEDVVGADGVVAIEPTMGSEDFAFMLREKPGCYVMIGNGDGTHRDAGHGLGPCQLHNPSYDFNDELIPVGASYWVRLVEKFLPPR